MQIRTYDCDFYELDISIGKIVIPYENDIDKCRTFYIYPGVSYLQEIIQHFGYEEEYKERQLMREHIKKYREAIENQVDTFEENLPDSESQTQPPEIEDDPYGYS